MEERGVYQLGPSGSESVEIRPECLRAFANGWVTPTKEEIRHVQKLAGNLGRKTTGDLCGVSGKTVNFWTTGEKDIPYAPWAILCAVAGLGHIWEH